MYEGSHPMPSPENVTVSKEIVDLSERLGENDLVIVVVSGGGSSLLCWPPEECEQGQKLYQEFLNTGGSIQELNTLRKHISFIKGGGLAKILYPAHVVALIFSDVPGDGFSDVASGLTYKDTTTVDDAKAIISKYNLGKFGNYILNETPKEDMYFERVLNIPMVSNQHALDAMASTAKDLGYMPTIISNQLYDSPEKVCDLFFEKADSCATGAATKIALLAGGEPALTVPTSHGRGGRNQHLALTALGRIQDGNIFISIGSDGVDNSLAAGAIADATTREKALKIGISGPEYMNAFNSFSFFEKTGDAIITGPTGANVSDLMVLLRDHIK
jgi:glycerate-2-kinase